MALLRREGSNSPSRSISESLLLVVLDMKWDKSERGSNNVRFVLIDIVGEVDQSHNVDRKLSKNRSNDVDVEDIRLRALLRQTLDRLCTFKTLAKHFVNMEKFGIP